MNFDACVQYISDFYFSDTIELFDDMLYDRMEDPQHSAITTFNRFWVYIQFKKATDEAYQQIHVSDLLSMSGYSSEDIALFQKKIQDERPIYHGAIFDNEFL